MSSTKNDPGYSLLKAVHKRSVGDIEKALLRGANIDCILFEEFALGRAAEDDRNYDIARLLLEHGANVNLCNDHGVTALMIACSNSCIRIAQLLAKNGAQLYLRDKSGNFALDYARHQFKSLLNYVSLVHIYSDSRNFKKGST